MPWIMKCQIRGIRLFILPKRECLCAFMGEERVVTGLQGNGVLSGLYCVLFDSSGSEIVY